MSTDTTPANGPPAEARGELAVRTLAMPADTNPSGDIFGGEVRYVLASSGHIAGIINPPGGKGTFWANEADPPPPTAAEWRKGAARHDGSWWTDWTAWLAARSGKKGRPPAVGSAAHPPIADAPGTYVLEK